MVLSVLGRLSGETYCSLPVSYLYLCRHPKEESLCHRVPLLLFRRLQNREYCVCRRCAQSLPVFRIAPDVVGSVLLGYIASPWIPFLIDVCKIMIIVERSTFHFNLLCEIGLEFSISVSDSPLTTFRQNIFPDCCNTGRSSSVITRMDAP